jgi:hypothetical protein
MSKMQVMDETGDTKVEWNPDIKDEVEAARKTFDSLKAKGYQAYAMTPGSKKGDKIDKFDHAAKGIIMVPELKGHDATLAMER